LKARERLVVRPTFTRPSWTPRSLPACNCSGWCVSFGIPTSIVFECDRDESLAAGIEPAPSIAGGGDYPMTGILPHRCRKCCRAPFDHGALECVVLAALAGFLLKAGGRRTAARVLRLVPGSAHDGRPALDGHFAGVASAISHGIPRSPRSSFRFVGSGHVLCLGRGALSVSRSRRSGFVADPLSSSVSSSRLVTASIDPAIAEVLQAPCRRPIRSTSRPPSVCPWPRFFFRR